jgi:predicted nucleic acid-binding protein
LPRRHRHWRPTIILAIGAGRQVTDALLLGLAIRNGAILVTLDLRIQALAGEAYAANLLTLA